MGAIMQISNHEMALLPRLTSACVPQRCMVHGMRYKHTRLDYRTAAILVMSCIWIGCASDNDASEDNLTDSSSNIADMGTNQNQTDGQVNSMVNGDSTAPRPMIDAGLNPADSGPGGVIIPIPDDLSEQFADAICRFVDRCQFTAVFSGVVGEPCTEFMTRQFEDATIARMQPLIETGEVSYNPVGTRSCIRAIDNLACTIDFASLTSACLDSFQGNRAVGQSCSETESCGDGQFCSKSDQCPGRCEFQGSADAGCTSDAACEFGLTCAGGTCAGPAAINGRCGGDGPACEGGLYCDGENGGPGRCQVYTDGLVDEGEICDIAAGPLCNEGLACIVEVRGLSAEFRCRVRVDENARCAPGFPDHCDDGFYCGGTDINGFVPDLDGRCRALPSEGQACGQAPAFKVCALGNICDGDLCKPRGRLGDACQTNDACYSGQCTDGVCGVNQLCPP